ncbi:MAG: DNA polymerase III subunit beta [Nitrospirales bacterium]|nr:MAG: DNA polymerase III subunit beta [Nitrospirales bacterium]
MKFTCARPTLLKSLQLFSHALDKRSSDSHALHYAIGMSTHQDHLTLRATTHDQHFHVTVPATILMEGQTILPFDVILEFIKTISHKTLTLSIATIKGKNQIQAESSQLILPPVEADWSLLAPPLPDGTPAQCNIPINVLTCLLEPVLSSVAKENGRYLLQAVQVQVLPTEPPTLIAVGTDGQRLTRITQETGSWITKPKQPETALIPKRTARLLVETARQIKDDITVSLTLTTSTWIFLFPDGEIRTQNLSGAFPNYMAIMPQRLSPTVKFSRAALIEALRRMEAISDPISHAVNIKVNESELSLSTVNAQVGEAHECVEATIQDSSMTLGFNGKFLLDGLGTTEAKHIEWSMDSPTAPCVMISSEDPHWTHVLMPVRMS